MRRQRLRGMLALAAPLLFWAAACAKPAAEDVATTDKVAVTTHAVERGDIHGVAAVTGVVKPAPGAELNVTPPQPARIAELPHAVGDRVRKGDLLVRFDIPSLEADASGKRAEVARAEARLETARSAAIRLDGLFERGVAARKEVDDAHRELADAQAGLAEAHSSRTATGALADRAVVRAPFAGVIASRGHNPGDLVDAGGDPILRLIDPSRLEIEVQVPPAVAAGLVPGQSARVNGPGGGAPEEAKVLTRAAALDPLTGTAAIRLAFSKPTTLPAGTPVRVELYGTEHQGVLLLPQSAIVEENGSAFVYTVDKEAHAHRKEVKLGVANGEQIECLSGVNAGETVVVSGQAGLPDGAAVAPTHP